MKIINYFKRIFDKPHTGFVGVKGPDVYDKRDFIYKPDLKNMKSKSSLNDEFIFKNITGPILNQGSTNSCTGHAAVVAMNILLSKFPNFKYNLNPFWIYYWARKKDGCEKSDSGAYMRSLMKALKEEGVWKCSMSSPFSDLPKDYDLNNTFKIKDYFRIDNNSEKIKYALSEEKLPVLASISIYNSDTNNYTGVIKGNKYENFAGLHAVPIIGWKYINNELYFIIQNSWGSSNGDGGLYYVYYKNIEMPSFTPDLWTFTYDYF